MRIARILIPCVMLLAMSVSSAKAYDGLGGLGLAYMYGYGYGGGYAVGAYNHNLPYFSLHPPVYYGQRYARPYGVSPFAAWPQLQAAEGYAPAPAASRFSPHSVCCPAVINNPHVPEEVTQSDPATSIQGPAVVVNKPVEPLVIENPYFDAAVQYTVTR